MEDEAARLLEAARSSAMEIAEKAREEARSLSAASISLDDAAAECAARLAAAKEDTSRMLLDADRQAEVARARARDNGDRYVQEIVRVVTGERA